MTNGPTDAERERIRGYLMAQGEKYRWLELWPRVVGARVALLDALSGVSEEQAGFSPAEDEWSIREVAHHVVNGSRGVARLIEQLARGEEPSSQERTDPRREPPEAAFEQLRLELAEQSAEFAGLVARLPEPPSLERTHSHMLLRRAALPRVVSLPARARPGSHGADRGGEAGRRLSGRVTEAARARRCTSKRSSPA